MCNALFFVIKNCVTFLINRKKLNKKKNKKRIFVRTYFKLKYSNYLHVTFLDKKYAQS